MAQNETAKAIVDVDGRQAGVELKKLEERAKELRNELSRLGKENDLGGFRQKEKELRLVQTQMKNLKKETFDVERVLSRLNGSSFNDLTKAQRQLNSELKRMSKNTQEELNLYNQKIAKLKQIDTQLGKVKNEMHAVDRAQNNWLSRGADQFNKYFGVVTAGVAAFTGVVFSIKSLIQGNVELDDSLADVRKTTGLTQKEVRELYSEFNTLNTRTPKKELLELAEEAGRLGISGKKNIMDFVDVANQIKVALGDDLGGDAAEAIKEVGKLTNVFKVGEKYGVDFRQSMLMVGSSINEVSANSAADAPFLIDMAKRMAGVSSQAGIAVQDIIGMAAALDEMGQTSEVSSTTLNKVIVNMFKDTGTYADIAGMNLAEFTELLNKDANEALIKVLEGLNGNNSGLSTMAQKLDGLGLDGARSVQTLAALASNIDLVRKNQDLANTSLESGTSLTNEYQVKNNNMAGSLEKIGRALKSAFVNSGLNEALTNIVTKVAKWVEIPVSRTMEDQRHKANILAIELTNLNTTEERKKKIYEELQAISPKIVEGLKLENINTEQLRMNLAKYNEEAIKKIAIQRAQEDLNEIQEKVGKQTEKRSEAEFKLNEVLMKQINLIKTQDKEKGAIAEQIVLSTSLTALDKFNQIHELTMGIKDDWGHVAVNFNYLNQAGAKYTYELEKENELIDEANNVLSKYQEKYKSILGTDGASPLPVPGVTSVVDPDAESGGDKSAGGSSGKSDNVFDKLAEQQAEFRMRIINESKSLIEQEKLAYQQRLKDAGLFGIKKEELTGEYLQAYEILESQHQENIKKINDQALSDEILVQKEVFDQVTVMREEAHFKEMAALGDNKEAKEALEKKYQKEELERQQNFLNSLIAEYNSVLAGEDIFPDIDETLLTEEQKEAIKIRIQELQTEFAKLGVEISGLSGGGSTAAATSTTSYGDAAAKTVKGDIFGMSPEDWGNLIQNIEAGNISLENTVQIIGAMTEAYSMYSQIRKNQEDKAMMQYESNTNRQKELLKKRLENGMISEEQYNKQIAAMDDDLDKKKKALAIKQAKREKAVALVGAIVNTALAVVKALTTQPIWLGIVMAALVGAMGAFQIATIASQPLPQYAAGKYDVIGAQDGKKYRAGMMDSPRTGLVNEPTILVGEKPEIIIDPPTTRNLQINYPEVIDAINWARTPQYFSGKYPQWSSSSTRQEVVTERELPKQFYDMMDRLNNQLEQGIGARLVADGEYMRTHNKVSEDYQDLRDQVSLRS